MVDLLSDKATANIRVLQIPFVAIDPTTSHNLAIGVLHRLFSGDPSEYHRAEVGKFIQHGILCRFMRKPFIGVLIFVLRLEICVQAQ